MDYKEEAVDIIKKIGDNGKEKLLNEIALILEALPKNECQRVYDYLTEFYLS